MKLTVAELFAGVGGFRVGLNHIDSIDENGLAIEKGDWEFVWANQFEPSTKMQPAFECYVKRFGEEKNSNVDINKVDKKEIPDHSLLVGGFPCQDYSVARSLSKEMGIEGKKGVLFWDIKDVIVEKKSPFILLENVDRLLKSPASQRGRDFAIMLKTFNELGYDAQWRVINAGDYSMPQKRRRVFIFAYKNNSQFSQWVKEGSLNLNEKNIFNDLFPVEEIKEHETINLNNYEDILDVSNNFNNGKFLESGIMIDGEIEHSKIIPISESKYTLSRVLDEAKGYNTSLDEFVVEDEKLEKWKYLKGSKRIERTSANGHKYIYSEGSMSFPENVDEPARTMLTSEGTTNRSSHIIYDKDIEKYRILTPVECELIQMFPPNWTDTMPRRNRYFMMGNALVTGIISRLELRLKEIISNEK
ncbi:5-methylcytosine methyltransferase [Peptoniphilus sp. HMSC075B08]|uniref:DNA (cytosine-5-)-methyltransferase n=1 Tax=Peptoniphilus sp. HMSC075B08 TaxID=1739525 RepID=UPI0008A5C86A|nr:DNA (cytosine-5-)-methyltransferase [Peptoniphilus sp. HMSC075B08]OFO61166.1 5-methylcytosine methyltransferase [Peptoniphilus sp. HMSC075B08]